MEMFPEMFPEPILGDYERRENSQTPCKTRQSGRPDSNRRPPAPKAYPDAPEMPSGTADDHALPHGDRLLAPVERVRATAVPTALVPGMFPVGPPAHPVQAAEASWSAAWSALARERAEAARFAADRGMA